MVLIEKLQNAQQLQRQQFRTEQILSAEHTIDEHEDIEQRNGDEEALSDMVCDDGNETDNDCLMALDHETDDDGDGDCGGNGRRSPPRSATPLPLEDGVEALDRHRIADELDKSKKLLNLYRSPMARTRTARLKAQGEALPFSFSAVDAKKGGRESATMCTPFKHSKEVLPNVDDSRVSVQLTPFHTPSIRGGGRARAALSRSGPHGLHSLRSVSTSPLVGPQRISPPPRTQSAVPLRHSSPDHALSADLAPISEQPVVHGHGRRATKNVWSRLTNPRHYVSTSRTRAQELETLKEKVRRQKESLSHLQQKKAQWKNHKMAHSPDHQQMEPPQHPPLELAHDAPGAVPSDHWQPDGDSEDVNKSVFMRLHQTRIRNTRNHLNSSLHGEDAMMIAADGHHHDDDGGGGFLSNEPSRIVNQNEISKKPQRNPLPNPSHKLMLTQPLRMATPDDDLC